MRHLSLESPAKVNLFLKIINKRTDNYHNIITLFERINLCDNIQLSLNKKGRICVFCDHPDVPTGHKNLTYQVAQLLKRDFGLKQGVDIKITKRIPVAAGLGGGSSNAATVLLGLNQIWGLYLSKQRLLEYAQKIGSDVPFFLHDCSWAIGTNKGDEIQKISIKTKIWHILITPKIKIYSAKIYDSFSFRRFNPQLTKINDDVNMLIHHLRRKNLLKAGHFLVNDLETRIFRLYPNLAKLKVRLNSLNAKGVLISGSGSSIFGLTDSVQQAEMLKDVLNKYYSQIFVVRTL